MGLVFFIGLNGLLAMAVFRLLRSPQDRAAAMRDLLHKPLQSLFLVVFVGSTMVAGWGILSLGRLSFLVETPWGRIQSWQLAGLIALTCLLSGFFGSMIRDALRPR